MSDKTKTKEELISELKALRKSAIISEERLRVVLEEGVDGSWEYNAGTGEFLCQGGLEESAGRRGNGIKAKLSVWTELVHPGDRKRLTSHLKKYLDGRATKPGVEVRVRRNDGTYKWVLVRGRTVNAATDGRPLKIAGVFIDVTERKAAEEALRESEAKFRNLAERSVAGVYLIQDELLRYVNLRFAETLGYRYSELDGELPVKDVIFPDDWPFVKENLRRRISGETDSLHYEFRMMTKEKEVRDAEVYSSRIMYRGRPAVIGTLLDVTERKRSVEMLKAAEEQYRSIFENAGEGIFQVLPDGAPIAVNRALAGMLGCRTPEEMISFVAGRGTRICVRPELLGELKRRLDEKGGTGRFEIEVRRKGGGTIWASVNARAIRAGDGSILRYEGLVEDVTKRKEAEEALTRSEAELRALVESMSDIIMAVDGKGRSVKVLAGPEWVSCPEERVHGRAFRRLFPGGDAGLFLKSVRKALKTHRTVNIEHHVSIDEKEYWFSIAVSPMAHGSAVCVARDITDLKTAEKDLEAKSIRLEETNTALKVLLANMEEARAEVEETIASNIRVLVMPYLEKLDKLKLGSLERAYVEVIAENLKNIASPFLHGLGKFNFTPTEIQVANYIRDGKTTKEVMALLNISKGAVDTHRYNIRRKLGLNKEKVNLCSHLRALR